LSGKKKGKRNRALFGNKRLRTIILSPDGRLRLPAKGGGGG